VLNRGAALNFRELAAPPNSAAWSAAWRPYVEPCIELFGAERCNFESNFPVDKMGTGYATLWNAFKRISPSAVNSNERGGACTKTPIK
jgi:L-fuconolactonase